MIIGATSAEHFNNEQRPLLFFPSFFFFLLLLMNDIFFVAAAVVEDARLALSSRSSIAFRDSFIFLRLAYKKL